jgi:GT2 family glycosyltransferase
MTHNVISHSQTVNDIGIALVHYGTADPMRALLSRWETEAPTAHRIHKAVIVDNDVGSPKPAPLHSTLSVQHIAVDRNRGYAAAVNTAWRKLHSGYVLLLNPAADIGLGDIEQMAEVLDSSPRVGAVAPLHVDGTGRPINRYHTIPTWLDLACHGSHLYRFGWAKRRVRRYNCDWLDGISPTWPLTPVEQAPASCLMLRRTAVTGEPMDERFPILFNDVDLSTRLRAQGWETLIAPHIICRHTPSISTRYLGVRTRAEGYLGAYRYLRKWYGRARSNAYRLVLVGSLALSARDRRHRRENLEAIRALCSNRSIFEDGNLRDPVRQSGSS